MLLSELIEGCSLSGILYSIAIEPFLLRLKRVLAGVSLCGEQKLSLSAYADEVMVAVTGEDDVEGMKMVVEKYGNLSSAKVSVLIWKQIIRRFHQTLQKKSFLTHCLMI